MEHIVKAKFWIIHIYNFIFNTKYTSIIRFYFPIEAFTLSEHKFAFCSSKHGFFWIS